MTLSPDVNNPAQNAQPGAQAYPQQSPRPAQSAGRKVSAPWTGALLALGALVGAIATFLPFEKIIVFRAGTPFATTTFSGFGSRSDTGRQILNVVAANGGKIMTPHLVKEVRAPDGGTVMKTHPSVWKTATSPQTAADLNTMMQAVVTGGTGTSAQIPGVQVAGKTGTAETCTNCTVYDAWFIFFAPADNPTVAGAVVVEHSDGGFGGAVAAPIARDLMQAMLPAASKG